jgi:hypothetical protein
LETAKQPAKEMENWKEALKTKNDAEQKKEGREK